MTRGLPSGDAPAPGERRLPLPDGLARGPEVTVTLDGRPVRAHLGESVAAVLIADSGSLAARRTARGEPRGVYCGMGVCFECLVVVDGVPSTRACMTWVRDGMQIVRQDGAGPRRDLPSAAA